MLSGSASSDTALSFSPVGELTRCGPGASSTMRYVPAAVRPTIWLSIATLSFEAPPKAPPARASGGLSAAGSHPQRTRGVHDHLQSSLRKSVDQAGFRPDAAPGLAR